MIYFIAEENDHSQVKIGYSKNLKGATKRLGQLQIGNPRKLELIGLINGTIGMERSYHRIFADYRLESEWFLMNPILEEVTKKASQKLAGFSKNSEKD